MRGPGITSRTVDRLTSNVDILPTVLEWAGVDPPKDFIDGNSFAAAARGTRAPRPRRGAARAVARRSDNPKPDCGGYDEEMG